MHMDGIISTTETSVKGRVIIQTHPPPSVAATSRNLCLSLRAAIRLCGSITLALSLFPGTTMNRLFSNKRKESPKPFPQDTSVISTDIAAGPVSYQAQPNMGPEGEQLVPKVDQPDLTVALDDRTGEGSQIVLQNRMDEDHRPHTWVASTSGVVIGGNSRTSASDPCDWD